MAIEDTSYIPPSLILSLLGVQSIGRKTESLIWIKISWGLPQVYRVKSQYKSKLIHRHRPGLQPSATGWLVEAGLLYAKPPHCYQRPTGGPPDVIRWPPWPPRCLCSLAIGSPILLREKMIIGIVFYYNMLCRICLLRYVRRAKDKNSIQKTQNVNVYTIPDFGSG